MNREEAKNILLCYRPGTADTQDPEVLRALALAEEDAVLAEWLENHKAFQKTLRSKFAEIPAPEHLKARLKTEARIVPLPIRPSWQRPAVWLAAAAAVVLVLFAVRIFQQPSIPDRFADFQSRMVSTALRQYRMDVVTPDMRELRVFLEKSGGPADYKVPEKLQRFSLTGGGLLRWRNNPVSMVCFDRGDKQMLYLFVMERSALKDPPPETPQSRKLKDLETVSWSEGEKAYFLAGPEEPGFLHKYM